jgi:hypothetical protein
MPRSLLRRTAWSAVAAALSAAAATTAAAQPTATAPAFGADELVVPPAQAT